MISTKSQYALKAMVYIALHNNELVKIKDISKREGISQKYLEQVISLLVKSQLLKSYRGNNGGYSLIKNVDEYSVYEIIVAVEGALILDFGKDYLSKYWDSYNETKNNYLKSIKLSNLLDDYNEYIGASDYCI